MSALRAARRRRSRLRWVAPIAALVLLAAWEAATRLGALPALFFPAPSTVAATLAEMIRSGALPLHFGATLSRMFAALAGGGGAGWILGMAMGWSPRLRAVLDPFVAVLHPVPKMSLLPLIMILFGIGFFSKALVVAISAFFPMVINSMAGVRQLDPHYFDVARLHGATRWRVFWRVVFPGSLPTVLAGARMAMNRALGATIGMELITADTGLGSMLYFAWQTLRTEELYASIFVIGAFGYGFRAVVDGVTRRMVLWQSEPPGF